MRDRPEDLASGITTREDMATFLDALSSDAAERASEWENLHILDMLESMAAWLRDTTDHEGFLHPALPPAHWRFVAELLLAGKHYE
jgi:predicted ATPase